MKRLSPIAWLAIPVLTAACSSLPPAPVETASAPAATAARQQVALNRQLVIHDAAGSAVLQKVEFHTGVSSATVERLAKRFGCTGGKGAGLIAGDGPIEIYRMRCDNGTTFTAQCEFRQCRPMR